MTEHHFYADNLVDALLEEGIPAESIWELDGWKTNQQGYYWTSVETGNHHGYDGVANGHLNHHTASSAYTPYVKNSKGQTKANVWTGMRRGDRLYQDGDGVPTLAITSAGPANYSAGSGVKDYVVKLRNGIEAGRQKQNDDDPKWYGNRFVWNTEHVCDGVGGVMADDIWDLIGAYNAALSRLHDNNEFWNGFHAGFTRRKIDFRDGRFPNAATTIDAIWEDVAERLGGDPPVIPPPIEPPIDPPPTERPTVNKGRSRAELWSAKNENIEGLDIEYWQNLILQIVEGVLDTGNSTKTFFYDVVKADEKGLTWKVWDEAFTAYFSAYTGRNSYGLGPTERLIIERDIDRLRAASY